MDPRKAQVGIQQSTAGSAVPPVLRWAGSKRKLLPTLLAHTPVMYRHYVEPFVGSACLFFALGPNRALLGDFNTHLIAFYEVLARTPSALSKELATYPVGESFYYELRSRDPRTLSRLQNAARFIYLNRYCFNAVYRTNQSGCFNVPYGSKTGQLPSGEALAAAARLLRNAKLITADFEDTLAMVERDDYVYIDPPYAASRYRGEYGYGTFAPVDLGRLESAITRLDDRGAVFLLSYKDDPSISARFSAWFQTRVNVRRHVAGFTGSRGYVQELLISNRPFAKEGV